MPDELEYLKKELAETKDLVYQLLDIAYSNERRITILENKENP